MSQSGKMWDGVVYGGNLGHLGAGLAWWGLVFDIVGVVFDTVGLDLVWYFEP